MRSFGFIDNSFLVQKFIKKEFLDISKKIELVPLYNQVCLCYNTNSN